MDGTAPNTLIEIPLGEISPDPTQPRRRMEPPVLDQLAASIRAQGILQAITVRPAPEGCATPYQLVSGERRWRAAGLAGLATITAVVRELDDREVLEVQIAENAQRADVHPLDEADAYRRLHEEHRVDVEEIAARAGHPVGRIRQRLSLATLVTQGREALLADRISLGIAQKIARLPVGDQVEAVAYFTTPRTGVAGAWTVEDAGAWIRGRYYLPLGRAPFDATDARLVPGAGPCPACPHNSAAQRDLFEDLSHEAHCTKPACHAEKVAATWARETRERAEKGDVIVASVDESNGALAHGLSSKGYVRCDEKPSEHGGRRSWRELLKKAAPPVVLVRHPVYGNAVEMYRPADLKKAVAAVGLKKAAEKDAKRPASPDISGDAYRARAVRGEALDGELLEVIAVRATDWVLPPERKLWQVLARVVALGAGWDAMDTVVRRRALTKAVGEAQVRAALQAEIESLPVPALRGLIFELCAASDARGSGEIGAYAEEIASVIGLDLHAVAREILARLDAQAAAKETKPAAKSPTKKTSAKAPAATADAPGATSEFVELALDDWPTNCRELDILDDGVVVLWSWSDQDDSIRAIVPRAMLARLRERAAKAKAKVVREVASDGPSHVVRPGDEILTNVGPRRIVAIIDPDMREDDIQRGLALDGDAVAWLDGVSIDRVTRRLSIAVDALYRAECIDGTWRAVRDENHGKAPAKSSAKKPAATAPAKPAPKPAPAVRVERVDTDVLSVLSTMKVEDTTARITQGQLDRKLYERTNKVLEALGGTWNKKLKGHTFAEDPTAALDGVILTGEVARARDVLGFFPTPPELVGELLAHADGGPGMTLLEPSAGEGAIVSAAVAKGYKVTAIEIDQKRHRALVAHCVSGTPGKGVAADHLADFLQWSTTERFDRVVMNPPFARQQDIDHVTRAFGFLVPGGRLVAIMSAGVLFRENSKTREFRELVGRSAGKIIENPQGSFRDAGTGVHTVTVVLNAGGVK